MLQQALNYCRDPIDIVGQVDPLIAALAVIYWMRTPSRRADNVIKYRFHNIEARYVFIVTVLLNIGMSYSSTSACHESIWSFGDDSLESSV